MSDTIKPTSLIHVYMTWWYQWNSVLRVSNISLHASTFVSRWFLLKVFSMPTTPEGKYRHNYVLYFLHFHICNNTCLDIVTPLRTASILYEATFKYFPNKIMKYSSCTVLKPLCPMPSTHTTCLHIEMIMPHRSSLKHTLHRGCTETCVKSRDLKYQKIDVRGLLPGKSLTVHTTYTTRYQSDHYDHHGPSGVRLTLTNHYNCTSSQ